MVYDMGLHKIKLIDESTDLSTLDIIEFDWDLVVNNRPYKVIRIEGYNHAIRGFDIPMNTWAYPRDEEMSYKNLIPVVSDNIVQWGITYDPQNKIGWRHGDREIATVGEVTITRNGKPFYTCCGDFDYAIALAKVLITRFKEHSADIEHYEFDKKLIGRKIWWRSQPAIITQYIDGQACVIIEPDKNDKFDIPAEYNNGYDRWMFDESIEEIKVEIISEHINWFRD